MEKLSKEGRQGAIAGRVYAEENPPPQVLEEPFYEFDLETARGQKTHYRIKAGAPRIFYISRAAGISRWAAAHRGGKCRDPPDYRPLAVPRGNTCRRRVRGSSGGGTG